MGGDFSIPMPATYVQISREEFEAWLRSLPTTIVTGWERNPSTAGIYYVGFSPKVGVKISSSIGKSDDVMGRGEASIDLALASMLTKNVLNRKASPQSRYHRTQNWKKNLEKGITHWYQVYRQNQDFYDLIAPIADRKLYKKERLDIVSRIPGMSEDPQLLRIQDILSKDGVLSQQQELIIKIAKDLRPEQVAFLDRLERLRKFAPQERSIPNLLLQLRMMIWKSEQLPSPIRQQVLELFRRFGV